MGDIPAVNREHVRSLTGTIQMTFCGGLSIQFARIDSRHAASNPPPPRSPPYLTTTLFYHRRVGHWPTGGAVQLGADSVERLLQRR